jgi:hypothetical protein
MPCHGQRRGPADEGPADKGPAVGSAARRAWTAGAHGVTRGLAELHVHLYGNIRWDDYLRYVEARDTDWTFYERSFESAFGRKAPVREILARHRDGDPQAAQDFRDLFVFADVDAGSFERFQAKFNLLINGSRACARRCASSRA